MFFDFAFISFKIILRIYDSKLFVMYYAISHFYLKGQLCRKINCRTSNFLYLFFFHKTIAAIQKIIHYFRHKMLLEQGALESNFGIKRAFQR